LRFRAFTSYLLQGDPLEFFRLRQIIRLFHDLFDNFQDPADRRCVLDYPVLQLHPDLYHRIPIAHHRLEFVLALRTDHGTRDFSSLRIRRFHLRNRELVFVLDKLSLIIQPVHRGDALPAHGCQCLLDRRNNRFLLEVRKRMRDRTVRYPIPQSNILQRLPFAAQRYQILVRVRPPPRHGTS
jgi:hypothetical protein